MSIVGGGSGITILNVRMNGKSYMKSKLIDECDVTFMEQDVTSENVSLCVLCNQMQSVRVLNYLVVKETHGTGTVLFHVELVSKSVVVLKYQCNEDYAFYDTEEMNANHCMDLMSLAVDSYPHVCYLNLKESAGDLYIPNVHMVIKNVSYIAVFRRPPNSNCISSATTLDITYVKKSSRMQRILLHLMKYLKDNSNEITGSAFDLMHYLCNMLVHQNSFRITWEIVSVHVENLIPWFFEPKLCNVLKESGLRLNTLSKNRHVALAHTNALLCKSTFTHPWMTW